MLARVVHKRERVERVTGHYKQALNCLQVSEECSLLHIDSHRDTLLRHLALNVQVVVRKLEVDELRLHADGSLHLLALFVGLPPEEDLVEDAATFLTSQGLAYLHLLHTIL